MSEQEADQLIEEATKQFYKYLANGDQESAEEICEEYFGLEPDYILELIGG